MPQEFWIHAGRLQYNGIVIDSVSSPPGENVDDTATVVVVERWTVFLSILKKSNAYF